VKSDTTSALGSTSVKLKLLSRSAVAPLESCQPAVVATLST
jgi:hypothetical protein